MGSDAWRKVGVVRHELELYCLFSGLQCKQHKNIVYTQSNDNTWLLLSKHTCDDIITY